MFYNSIKDYHNNVCGPKHIRDGGIILDNGSPYFTHNVYTYAHKCTLCNLEIFCINSSVLKICKEKSEFINDKEIQRIINMDVRTKL